MSALYGRVWEKRELLKRMGDIAQVCGTAFYELQDGLERGVLAIDFWTGAGLRFTVLPGRGMDIGKAEYMGYALAWQSATRVIHAAFYEPEAFNWLRGFHGGLMTTCGLVHAGWPAEDEGRTYGLHGRASYTPASNVVTDGYWDGDEYVIFAQGKVREAIVFGEHLELIRRIWTRLGERRLFVHDRIVNKGFERTPLMLLYHCNIGFPIVDEGAELIAPSIEVTPRDDIAASGLEEHNQVSAPQPNYKEQVFFHKLGATQDGNTVVAMVNPHLMDGQGLGVYIRFNTAELPQMVQWKMMGESTYVVGLEPTNLTIVDRIEAKEQGVLPYLESGEEREFHLEIGVVHGADEINALRTEVANLKG